jgi:hypothetical protein
MTLTGSLPELTYPGTTVFSQLPMDRARGFRNAAVVLFVAAGGRWNT